jgi:SAM-dependent methyltransferase/methyltransferase-like protein
MAHAAETDTVERFSYDTLPYPSKFFLQTFPDRLAAAGILYGMQPADPQKCRVLELGCGNGSNLIAQAYLSPQSQFIGIDLAQTHIDLAVESAKELDLTNIDFRQMDVMEMTPDAFGEFDYITAHGLFAWVPDFVRERVLSIFQEMLAPNGIGYISYNAYPGAYAREMVRSMMRFHTNGIDEPNEKVDKAIKFVGLLANNATEREIHGRILEFELKRHFDHFAADIYHDDLGEIYRPFYFHEFASLLSEHRMQFLSEAELHASSTQGLGQDAIDLLNATDDRVRREQYLDLFRGRVFRQTLFCRDVIQLDQQPRADVLDRLFLSSTISPVSDIKDVGSNKIEKFRTAKGQQMQIDHPLTKAALTHLGEIWARSIATNDLLEAAKEKLISAGYSTGDRDEQFETTRTILLQIALGSDMIELHSYAPDATTKPAYKPKVNRLARWQLRDASNVLTLLNKDLKLNDKTSRRLLELMDGTRSQIELERELRPFIKEADDLDDESRRDLLGSLKSWIESSVKELARLGLFEA